MKNLSKRLIILNLLMFSLTLFCQNLKREPNYKDFLSNNNIDKLSLEILIMDSINLSKLKEQFQKQTKLLNSHIVNSIQLDNDLKLNKIKLIHLNNELSLVHKNNIKTLKRNRYKFILYGASSVVIIRVIIKIIVIILK